MSRIYPTLGFLAGLSVAAFILVLGVFLWPRLYPAPFISQPPLSTAPADVQQMAQRLETLENQQAYNFTLLEWKLDQKLLIFSGSAFLISFVAAFLGWKTYHDLDKTIREKIRVTLENELYQLDPANLTVRLPKGNPDTPLIRRRLELSGLHNIKEYLELNKQCLRGLTIVPIGTPEEESRFRDFLKQEQPNPELAAFVLYTPDPRFRVSPDTLNQYERVATANMPATVITAVLAISRGLHREK
jgi:hypothetical protein